MLCDERQDVVRIPTATTRPRRPSEQDGDDYLFLPRSTFERASAEGGLVAVTVYDRYLYGVPLASLLAAFTAGKDAAVVVDPKGVMELTSAFPGRVVPVLLDPPGSLAAARLVARDGATPSTRSRTATMRDERAAALEAGCEPVWDDDARMTSVMLYSALRG